MICCAGLFAGFMIGGFLGGFWSYAAPLLGFGLGLVLDIGIFHRARQRAHSGRHCHGFGAVNVERNGDDQIGV